MIVVCYWLPVTHNREAGHRRIVNVYEAVRSRRSVRSFLARPVPAAALTRVLSAALLAPSGGKLQPWQVYLLSGSRLEDLKSRVRRRIAAGDHGDPCRCSPTRAIFPPPMPSVSRIWASGGTAQPASPGTTKTAARGSAPATGN